MCLFFLIYCEIYCIVSGKKTLARYFIFFCWFRSSDLNWTRRRPRSKPGLSAHWDCFLYIYNSLRQSPKTWARWQTASLGLYAVIKPVVNKIVTFLLHLNSKKGALRSQWEDWGFTLLSWWVSSIKLGWGGLHTCASPRPNNYSSLHLSCKCLGAHGKEGGRPLI